MKKLLIIILLPILTYAQSDMLLLFSGGIVYNGTELITNAIDRDMELGTLLYASNFATNTDGWVAVGTEVTLAGNIDGIYNEDNTLKINATATYSVSHRFLKVLGQNTANFYAMSYRYYIPTANDSLNQIISILNGFGAPTGADTTKGIWTLKPRGYIEDAVTGSSVINLHRFNAQATSDVGDSIYIKDMSIHQAPSYFKKGNHLTDTTTTYKQAGSYSLKITASAAGNGTTNTVTFGSAKFTAVTSGTNYRFQLYAYTSTANTTLTFKLGDIVKTAIVPTTGMSLLTFDFKATASTTGNILLYLDKAATVYLDEVSLKSGS